MYYYLIIGLQAYCLYHLYTNKNAYYWWFVILFLGPIGCAIYLITQVYNKRDAEKITNEFNHIINPTKKITDLKKQLQFSESYQNRVNLADAYLEIKDYNNALKHYLETLDDISQNNFYVISKLVETYYAVEDYKNSILYAEKVKDKPEFKKSKTQFLYGLALEKLGDFEAAEINLRQIDIRYSFYEERLVLAKFLLSRENKADGTEILQDICNEYEHMTKPNSRLYRLTFVEAEKLLSEKK